MRPKDYIPDAFVILGALAVSAALLWAMVH